MRRKMRAENKREANELKQIEGGIVDLEFSVQALVLGEGPNHPALRENKGNHTLLKRLAWVAQDGVIEHVFYPAFPPDRNADEVLTWNQIYETISQAVGVSAKLVHIPSDFIIEQEPSMLGGLLGDKSHSVVFDNSKVKRSVPSFEAKISFKEGVKRVLDEFERNPERKIVNPDVHTTLDRVLAAYRR